jgi:hypothetical protein
LSWADAGGTAAKRRIASGENPHSSFMREMSSLDAQPDHAASLLRCG